MRITILAIGSRGDVQPLVALAIGLNKAGFQVRCCAPSDFEGYVRSHGLEFYALTKNVSNFFGGLAGIALREKMRHAREFTRFCDDYLATFLDRLLVSCFEASLDADAIMVWPWTRIGPSLGERLGVPVFIVSANPVLHLPTRGFANPFLGPQWLRLGPLYNRYTWRWALPLTKMGQPAVDRWRHNTLGLSPISWKDELQLLRGMPHLFGFSPTVLPKPSDWDEWIHVTGYWLTGDSEPFRPPAELDEFLRSGEPPVAIGFSSQVGRGSARVTQIMVDALERAGKRGILITAWGGLNGAKLPTSILAINQAPYDWLLPRVAAMVHHGGAGSTACALASGTPSFAVPFGFEQSLWGQRIAKLGAGVAPIYPDHLSVRRVANAIRKISEVPSYRARAAQAAERIRQEDGVGNAVRLVTRRLEQKRRHGAVFAI